MGDTKECGRIWELKSLKEKGEYRSSPPYSKRHPLGSRLDARKVHNSIQEL
jgi:hypothetical protein